MIPRVLRAAAIVVGAATLVTACSSDPDDSSSGADPSIDRAAGELAGYRRDPAPDVSGFALPDLASSGRDVSLRADAGELLVVYFGYTNCPDYCPTTLQDLRLAMNRLDPSDADRIDVAMITVDPDRDLPVLADYIGSFFADGLALGTDDTSLLNRVAAPFGVAYDITETANGIEVGHTTSLYAIDDRGELTLTWQFGVSIADLKTDLEILLDGAG